jgi:hypothetical protein
MLLWMIEGERVLQVRAGQGGVTLKRISYRMYKSIRLPPPVILLFFWVVISPVSIISLL